MTDATRALSPEARAIVLEEEALLARVLAALAKARAEAAAREARGAGESRSVEALRELRAEAAAARAEDLGPLLHEIEVRQRLRERAPEGPLPDPAAPYVAHLRVNEGRGSRDYLLGRATLLDPAADVRVVDWRVAPVAKIFYRHREGDAYEETLPGRVAEGVVEARRIVVVADGALTRIVGDGFVLTRGPDGAWSDGDASGLALAPGGAGRAARGGSLGVGAGSADRQRPADVTALLDADQFAAIAAPPEAPLLVLGSAGSGKTTVALHRFARIAAAAPARYPLDRMRVVVPEEGLARLSRRLLEPLGVPGAQVETLDAWAVALARQVFGDAVPALVTDAPGLVVSLKRHPALYRALRGRFGRRRPEGATLRHLRRRLAELFTDRTFLGGVVEAAGGALSRASIEETVRHTMLQLATPLAKTLESIVVPEMKRAIDGREVWEDTPDALAGTLDLEDLPILLFLRAWRAGLGVAPAAHLVLDEAEDLALFELYVFGRWLGAARSVTLAGDEAQQTTSSFAGWGDALAALGAKEAATVRLAVSYRCPRPVAELARTILGASAPEGPARAARDGAPVGRFHFPTEGQAQLFVAGAARDLLDREPRASVAVLARSPEAAARCFEVLREVPGARLVRDGDFSFEPGLDVTDVESAKGLEWDYVVVPDASAEGYPDTGEARRRLHVAVTRAAHQVWLVAVGRPSPLLGGE